MGSCPASYGFIGGGSSNVLCAGATHSSIMGGDSNTVNAACATVIGGSGNTVTHNYAAVFGNGINSAVAGTMHINNLWLDPATYNTWIGIAPPFTFAPGTIYVDVSVGNGYLRVQL